MDEACVEELVELSSEMDIGAGGIRAILEDAANVKFYEVTRNKDKTHTDAEIEIGPEDIRSAMNVMR